MALEHWAAYYRSGALVSCPTGTTSNYEGALRAAWHDFFMALPDQAHILDLGTGNGAVALLAKQVAAECGRRFSITGIDLAPIDPARDVADGAALFDGITFQGGVSAEALPCADGCMDALSSQYAIEYSDLPKALSEVWRVLKKGAAAQLILHHHHSVVVRNAHSSLQQRTLVDDSRVLFLARRYVKSLHGGDRQHIAQTRAALMQAGERVAEAEKAAEHSAFLSVVIDTLQGLLNDRSADGRQSMLARIDLLEQNLGHWEQRLHDLVRAALSAEDLRAMEKTAKQLGFSNWRSREQYQEDSHLLGWCVQMTKPVEAGASPS